MSRTAELLQHTTDNQNRSPASLIERYQTIRTASESLCEPLEIEDYGIQTMPDVSPPKWHLAHTSWFFETFLLEPFLPSYRPFHPDYQYLFNSYYEQVGAMHPRSLRGQLSRPTVAEVYRYRAWIDEQLLALLETADADRRTAQSGGADGRHFPRRPDPYRRQKLLRWSSRGSAFDRSGRKTA